MFAKVIGDMSNRWWLWVVVGADTTVFRIERFRSTGVLIEHLGIDGELGIFGVGRRLLIVSEVFTA